MSGLRWYTYLLIDPRDKRPFYVGKGTRKRMYKHELRSHNWRLKERFEEIKATGLKIIYEKWFESEDEDFCYFAEIFLIDYFGWEILCNIHRGGKKGLSGADHPCKDPKVRAKLREANLGKKLSEETKAKIRHALSLNSSNRGKHLSNETKAKLREVNLGKRHSEEAKNKMRGRISPNKGKKFPGSGGAPKGGIPWNKGKKGTQISPNRGKKLGPLSEETKAKMSLSHKGQIPWNKGKSGYAI